MMGRKSHTIANEQRELSKERGQNVLMSWGWQKRNIKRIDKNNNNNNKGEEERDTGKARK